jgi:hypothetical protein
MEIPLPTQSVNLGQSKRYPEKEIKPPTKAYKPNREVAQRHPCIGAWAGTLSDTVGHSDRLNMSEKLITCGGVQRLYPCSDKKSSEIKCGTDSPPAIWPWRQ